MLRTERTKSLRHLVIWQFSLKIRRKHNWKSINYRPSRTYQKQSQNSFDGGVRPTIFCSVSTTHINEVTNEQNYKCYIKIT